MRVLCCILVCLVVGIRSNILNQHGRHGEGLNPNTRRVSITKAEVVQISPFNLNGSSSPVTNRIPLGSPKHQTNRRPHSRVPHFNISPITEAESFNTPLSQHLTTSPLNEIDNSSSPNSRPILDRRPFITIHSSDLNDPSTQANQNSPASLFEHIPTHSSQAVYKLLHYAAGAEPSHVSPSIIQGSSQHNSPPPVLGHGKTSHLKKSHKKVRPSIFTSLTSALPNDHEKNVPINFPTASSFPLVGRSEDVKGSPFTAYVSLAPSSQDKSGGVPVALFRDSPSRLGLAVNDFLPPGFIR